MEIINFFKQKIENFGSNTIGKFESSPENLANTFVALCERTGLLNPTSLSTNASKGIVINKKDNKYLIELQMFKPPITLEWTSLENIDKLFNVLDSISESDKKIGYINIRNLDEGSKVFQLAIGN